MPKLKVERLSGLASFGGPMARIRSLGEIEETELSSVDRNKLDKLFDSKSEPPDSKARDTFRYRITRKTAAGTETVEVPEDIVPKALRQCVKDDFVPPDK